MLLTTIFIALFASHGYLILQVIVRHILERALWRGSIEENMMEAQEMEVREARVASVVSLKGLDDAGVCDETSPVSKIMVEATGVKGSQALFQDRGLREIENSVKTE